MTKPYWSFSNPAKAYTPKIVFYKYKTRFANGYGLNVILVSSDNVHVVKSKRYRISANGFHIGNGNFFFAFVSSNFLTNQLLPEQKKKNT